MKATALSKYNRISTKKLRRVVSSIERMSYQKAILLLSTLSQKGARILEKTLKSAGANLQNLDSSQNEESWIITEIQVNQGPSFKRIRPRARGRADRIIKPTSHLRVVVSDTDNN